MIWHHAKVLVLKSVFLFTSLIWSELNCTGQPRSLAVRCSWGQMRWDAIVWCEHGFSFSLQYDISISCDGLTMLTCDTLVSLHRAQHRSRLIKPRSLYVAGLKAGFQRNATHATQATQREILRTSCMCVCACMQWMSVRACVRAAIFPSRDVTYYSHDVAVSRRLDLPAKLVD